MIAGHFGLAAAAKAGEPRMPLWAAMLATVWLDVVFVPLYLSGVETLSFAEGLGPGYGHAVIHADYTHSLVGALALSALLGAVALPFWGRVVALWLAGVSLSHWLLDLVVHRFDLPILPGNFGDLPRLGLGVWQWPWASAAIELALVAGGAWLYWRAAATVPADEGKARRARLVALLILLGGVATLAGDVTGVLP